MPILENVRVSFVAVIEPQENLSGEMAYSAQIHIQKDDKANIKVVDAAIEKAAKKGIATIWGGKKPKFRYEPKRDGDAELASGDQEDKTYAGIFFISTSKPASKGKPGVVDENTKPVMDPDKIYSGCYCNVEVSCYPYDKGGNKGIGWGLSNIMFVEDGDRLDGQQSAQDAFASLAPQTPDEEGSAF